MTPLATSYITGFSLTDYTGYALSAQVTGKVYAADMADPTPANLTKSKGDLTIAFNDAAGRTPIPVGPYLNPGAGNLAGLDLGPGLYKFTGDAIATTDFTLSGNANDVWIFQIAAALDVSNGVKVTLAGGAQASHIFWQLGSGATLGTTVIFHGTIMAYSSVVMKTGATLNGRAMALNESVTLQSNTITVPPVATFTLNYEAGTSGSLTGVTSQTVSYGEYGTTVTAVPETGYHFVQWSDGATTNPRVDSYVTTNISVTAFFAINQYTLTYYADVHGSISGPDFQTVNYDESGSAVLAVADPGYHFVEWSDGILDNPRTDTNVTTDITVAASFAINIHMLTLKSVSPDSGVWIAVSPLDNIGQGSGATQISRIYDHNTTVTLTAPVSALNGNLFYRWLIDGAEFAGNQSRSVQVLMNASRTMTAIYHSDYPILTIASQNPDSGINITVNPADAWGKTHGTTQFTCQYRWRSMVTLTAPPSLPSGWVFSKWLKDGNDFPNNMLRAVLCSMDTDHTMTAVFAHPYNTSLLTVDSLNPASGAVVSVYPADLNSQTVGSTQFVCAYRTNSMVTLTARGTAPNGYVFWKWLRDGADFPSNTYRDVLCSMGADHTMTAVYTHPYNTALLTVASSSPASGAVVSVYPADLNNQTTGSTQFICAYRTNSMVTLTARGTAPNGYVFWKWLRDGADFPSNTYRDVLCSMNADHTMTAVYRHPANTALLTVASSNPNSGAVVSIYPADKNNQTTGTTQFVASYAPNSLITLTARGTAPNGNVFWKWLKDGADFPNNTYRDVLCSMNADRTMTAVYRP